MVGGGLGSQIGEPHRIAARMDGLFALDAAALDLVPARGRAYARELGVAPARAYGDWQAMLAGEGARDERLQLVTVATPNSTHFEIARALMRGGFNVFCEKPLTVSVEQAVKLARTADETGRLLAVNFCYSGYPMMRQARAMVEAGELGHIRVVVAEFAHGHHADAAAADNPRSRWRYDPAQAGNSAVMADCGIHALHLATYVTGQPVRALSADFASCVPGRVLEDDALLALEFDGGARGRLWTSAVAVGQMHGLTLRVFGERGGLRWAQEQPDQLYWTPLGQATRIVERGGAGAMGPALAASRVAGGHPQGFVSAISTLYRDLHAVITGDEQAGAWLPGVAAGVHMVKAVAAAARSAAAGGQRQTV